MREEQLPIQSDFYTHSGDLDGQHAWKCFGGLTLDQARAKFLENPQFYQEDFMFMGGKAFAYYFPVIEEYLNAASWAESTGDRQMWILSCGIRKQFSGVDVAHVQHLVPRVLALAAFVIRYNAEQNKNDCEERERVAEGWEDLVRQVKNCLSRA